MTHDERNSVAAWWQEHGVDIVLGRQQYRWPPRQHPETSIRERAALAERCTAQATATGTLSKELGAEILAWGFNGATAAVDRIDAARFEATMREAYNLARRGDLAEAASVVVSLAGIGISTATKLLALPSGGALVIYDHRTARALRGLELNGRGVHIPASRSTRGTTTSARALCQGYALYSEAVELILAAARRDRSASSVLRTRDDVETGLFMEGGRP
jgi:hypothetical protein